MDSTSCLLRKIVRCSYRSKGYIDAIRPPPPVPPLQPQLSLTLPDPTPIASSLVRKGWDAPIAEQLSEVYLQHATELKSDYQLTMNKAISACLQTTPSLLEPATQISSLYATYETKYKRELVQLMLAAEQRLSSPNSRNIAHGVSRAPDVRKGSFKQHVTSILEVAFLHNPYPQTDQKQAIARLTGLEYKKVHTWFQNRRCRSKRQGNTLQKFGFVIRNNDNSYIPCEPIAPFPSPPSNTSRASQPVVTSTQGMPSPAVSCPFDMVRPPHAFPTAFSPINDSEPFPVLQGKQTFDVPWLRDIATVCNDHKFDSVVPDIEQLCAPLSRLTMADELSLKETVARRARKHPKRSCDHAAACFPVLICPPTAPLPALIRTTVTVRGGTTRHSTSPSLSNHVCVQKTPMSSSGPSLSRKPSHNVPRRVSQPPQEVSRNAARPYQPKPPTRFKARQTRLSRLSSTSSLSSFTSDDSYSSRASSASLDSPPPLTPPQLPAALPHYIKTTVPDTIFSSSQDLGRLFGDMDPSRHPLLAHPSI